MGRRAPPVGRRRYHRSVAAAVDQAIRETFRACIRDKAKDNDQWICALDQLLFTQLRKARPAMFYRRAPPSPLHAPRYASVTLTLIIATIDFWPASASCIHNLYTISLV